MNYLLFSFITFLLCPVGVFAAEFVPLVGIPGLEAGGGANLENYINALYILAISIAAFLTVMKLIYAGVQYILSDIVTSKENAKKDIRNSFIGLFIVLGAVVLLNTVNPQLTNLNALSNLRAETVQLKAVPVTTVANDTAGLNSGREACLARKAEGYEFKIYGTSSNRSYECCKSGVDCSIDATKTTPEGIVIDTAKEYSNEEMSSLRQELQKTGNLIYFSDVVLSAYVNEEESKCSKQSGVPYQVKRKMPTQLSTQVFVACMKS